MAQKRAFFEELWNLDEESDDEPEKCDAAAVLDKCEPSESRKKRNELLGSKKPAGPPSGRSLSRTTSAPLPKPSTSIPRVPTTRTASPLQQTATHSVKDKKIYENAPVTGMKAVTSETSRKRKRAESFNLMPESRQVFKGCLFYFFPNNDINSARRFRIKKAKEYGAIWEPEWKEGITHVIADRGLTYDDLLKWLKQASISADIAVVSEDYPADCIRFGLLINPRQYHYQLKAQPQSVLPGVVSGESAKSLELKPQRGKSRLTDSPQTPSPLEQRTVLSPFDSNERSEADADVTHVPESPSVHPGNPRDMLSEAIEEVNKLKDIPLDLDEELTTPESSDISDLDHSEDESREGRRSKAVGQKSWQQSFSCMSKNDGIESAANPNARTIEILQQMQGYYEQTKDQWRSIAYRKVISALKKEKCKITTAEQAIAIPGVGSRLADKIQEIVSTDRLRRLEYARLEPNDKVLQTFLGIYGVGFKQATQWIRQGHRTLEDLRQKAHLTENQKVGIAHYDDFQKRIPRAEMDQHAGYLKQAIRRIDSSLQLTICGSYRRGQTSSGDIDVIVTRPDVSLEHVHTIMMGTVIPKLFKNGYLKVGLVAGSKASSSKWHGAAALAEQAVWRRIDFLFVPWDEMGAALIYFTGNDIFNRSIRLLASKKGMRLNQQGLWKDVSRGERRKRLTKGTLVEARDEKKIFELLDVPWRPPEHRLC